MRKYTLSDEEKKLIAEYRNEYRQRFGIVDKFLINYHDEENDEGNHEGYIVFIDPENDLDFVDERKISEDEEKYKPISEAISKIQRAEAVQVSHLPEEQVMEFKKMLGTGMVNALNGNLNDIDKIIEDAKTYLNKRNREHSRKLFLYYGLPTSVIAAILGLVLHYVFVSHDKWIFGILFGILGSFVSIWTRYGRVLFTGHAQKWLHFLECVCRLFVGTIFAVVAMVALSCKLILPGLTSSNELYAFILVSFVASFSERFVPSIVERMTNEQGEANAVGLE